MQNYKNSLNDDNKNNFYLQLADDTPDLDINNYDLRDYSKIKFNFKEIEPLTISNAIKALKNEVAKHSSGKSDPILEIILDVPPILQSLKNLNYIMETAKKTLGTEKDLNSFPYDEISYILSNIKDAETIIMAINCFEASLKFNSDSIESKLTEEAINSLIKLMFSKDKKLSQSVILFIGNLNQYSSDLCEIFCSAGFAAALTPKFKEPYALFAIQYTITNCSFEHSFKFLFLLFKSFIDSEEEIILLYFYHIISIFSQRFKFDSIPELLSDDEIEKDLEFDCKKIIFESLKNYMSNPTSDNLIINMVELCVYIPENYSLEIQQELLNYLTNQELIEKYPNLAENISIVIIKFYNQWKEYIQFDHLKNLYDFITEESINFKISFSYVKIIVTYYQIQSNDFDIAIVDLCARYICCSDGSFLSLCIGLINKIILNFGSNSAIKFYQCVHILNLSRENLDNQITDPELNSDDALKIQFFLRLLDKFNEMIDSQENENYEN